eukprot:gene34201-40004_t
MPAARPAPPYSLAAYDLGRCRLDDAAAHADALGRLMTSFDPWKTAWKDPAEMAERFRRDDPAARRFAILKGGRLVGAVIVRYPFLRGAYLEMLGLAPEARGSGIGGAVIDWMEAEVTGVARNLWLCVTDWNVAARRFYAAKGFGEVAPIPDLAVDGVTEIFMRKRI